MPGESYRRRLRSLLLRLFDVFGARINSLVWWFCTGTLGLFLPQSFCFFVFVFCFKFFYWRCYQYQTSICTKWNLTNPPHPPTQQHPPTKKRNNKKHWKSPINNDQKSPCFRLTSPCFSFRCIFAAVLFMYFFVFLFCLFCCCCFLYVPPPPPAPPPHRSPVSSVHICHETSAHEMCSYSKRIHCSVSPSFRLALQRPF